MSNFAKNFYRLRKEKGLSQEEVGKILKVYKSCVSKWERGETTPSLDRLIDICNLFGCDLNELAGYKK